MKLPFWWNQSTFVVTLEFLGAILFFAFTAWVLGWLMGRWL